MQPSKEHTIKVLYDFAGFRFVRQLAVPWPHPWRPTVRGLEDSIVCGYSTLDGGGIGRVWFVAASPGVVDGMQLDPAVVPVDHAHIPVVPRSVHCNETPMPYHYCPETALDAEREKRSSHVGYWELQRKLSPRPQPQRPGLLSRLFG